MPREDAFTKARRLLAEGRVSILRAGHEALVARVRGDSARLYRAGYEDGRWYCACPAKSACAHVLALQLIWLEPEDRP